jgi:hypothetical protein
MSSSNDPVYVILTSLCEHRDSGDHSTLSAHFKFLNYEIYEANMNMSYDNLIDSMGEWFEANDLMGWFCTDEIEGDQINESDSINPILVTN